MLIDEEADGEVEDVFKGASDDRLQVAPYKHYRTQIGSPSINKLSFTEDEMKQFQSKIFVVLRTFFHC